MALRKICKIGEDVLRKKCKPVTVIDKRVWALLDDMAQTMYDANGVGLAAPQVGLLKRIVVIDVGEGLLELINPEVLSVSGEQTDEEGCLSIPERRYPITRPNVVEVHATNRHGKGIKVKGEGLLARALCHEIDHLDGKLFIDLYEPEKNG